MPLSTDGETAVAGCMQLLLASAPFVAAVGQSGGIVKVYRDTIPQGVLLPAVVLAKGVFIAGSRPIRQGGVSTQLQSLGTVTAYVSTDVKYSGNLSRLVVDALDNQAEVVVTGMGVIRSIRYSTENDDSVTIGEKVFKLTNIIFNVAVKAYPV